MVESGEIHCPFCGQTFSVSIDPSVPDQRLTVDCEICCRPIEIRVACEAGEIVSLETLN